MPKDDFVIRTGGLHGLIPFVFLVCRDLDDAVSIEAVDDGRYRVGVHVADVGYFVKEGSTLDEAASKRATSVYLVQQMVPMLPKYGLIIRIDIVPC